MLILKFDSRDIDQATFALLGIEQNSVDFKTMDDRVLNDPSPQIKKPSVNHNTWENSEISNLFSVPQNNEMPSAHLIQEHRQNTKIDRRSFNNEIGQDVKGFLPNVKSNDDVKRNLDDPPPIHIPVSQNPWVNEQTLSNMINMPQDMLQTDKGPPVQLGNENSKMSKTSDHSLVNGDMTANTFKDSFGSLDHLDFGFDNFEEDLINHKLVN